MPVTIPVRGTALLLIDVINDLEFPGPKRWSRRPSRWPRAWRRSSSGAVTAGVPCIYVNDNFGQWQSDFRRRRALPANGSSGRRCRAHAADQRRLLRPQAEALRLLLHHARDAARLSGDPPLIVTGIAGNICVLFTANDAYMRGLKIVAPADCIVSNTVGDNDSPLRQIELVLKGDITPSTRLRFGQSRG